MSQRILAVAIYEPLPGKEEESLATMRELGKIIEAAGYGRDQLFHDGTSHYVLVRYWNSEDTRRAALEDPAVLRCWAKVAHEIEIVKVYENLTEID